LHLEKAFDVTRFGPQLGGKLDPVTVDRDGLQKTFLAACRYFAAERWQFAKPVSATISSENFELWIVIHGGGSFRWSNESTPFGPAQVWLVPAGLNQFEIAPESKTTILRTYVPADLASVAANWTHEGVSEAGLKRLVFP
jgi:mannose-6-phosphate isomerase class I